MHALWKKSAGLAVALAIVSCAGSDVTGPSTSANAAATTVIVSPSADTLAVGDTIRLKVTATSWHERRAGYLFATSDSTVATVDNAGLVTARGMGTAYVSATSLYSGSTAHVQIVVNAAATTSAVARVVLSADSVPLAPGDSAVIGFHAYDANGQITWAFDSASVQWASTVPSAVSVLRNGLGAATIKALASGHSYIIVSIAGRADTCYVPVSGGTSQPTVATVKVALNASSLNVGQATQAVATALDSTGVAISGLPTTWSTNDTTVATVSASGLVTAKKSGSASVIATVSGKTGSATLTVAAQTPASITLSANAPSISVGQSTQVTAVVKDAGGNVLSTAVTWSTSSTAIAGVSTTGLVTGMGVGTATITATSGTVQGSTTINITAPIVATGLVAATPELPRVYLNTSMPTVTGKSIVVPAGGDLQAAIDQAVPGDEIVLQAGATYTGNFNLPVKSGASATPGSGSVIVIRSSGIANLPAGRRVSPSDAPNMAKVMTNVDGAEVFGTSPGTAGWRLVGLEITSDPSVTLLGRLVRFGDGNPTQNTASQIPWNLIVDRSWVHGTSTVDVRRCIDLQSGASAVVDSYVSDCHSGGSDAQAICGWNGPGPYRIVNNYLEGSGENVMFGGADPTVPNVVPSDIEFRGNYVAKPVSWMNGPWAIKNLFELKMGQRVLIEGNVFEHTWTAAQVGFALLLKSNNSLGLITQDVTVRHNIVRGAAGGVNIAGVDANGSNGPGAVVIERVALVDNLLLDIGSTTWDPSQQNGRLFQWFNATDVTIAHNTGFSPNLFVSLDSPASPRLDFHDNIVNHGAYGLKGTGTSDGLQTLDTYVTPYFFAGNVIIAGGDPAAYPAGNFFAASMSSVGFTNPSADDYSLTSGSPYKGKATDGSDPGIKAATLGAATNGVKQ